MKAVVLVGGEGTRLRPLTFTTPKPLLPIANQPFLERQLEWLARHGIDEVVLSLGYLPDAFVEHFPDGRFGDVTIRYAVEDKPLGTAGGIRFAADGIDERFVVCNGDVLTGLDLTAMVDFHERRGGEATICLSRVEDPSMFGVVPTRADGEVVGFIEKPRPGTAPTDWINAGTYILEPSVLERIPPRLNWSIERETFPRMVETRGALFAYPSDAYWLDIGTPEKYLQAHVDLLAGALGSPPVAGAVETRPGIWVVEDGACCEGASLQGRVLLGPRCRIEPGAVVDASVLGHDVVLSPGARVERSVLLPGARLGEGAVVVDSVVGEGAVVGRDAVLADQTIVGARQLIDDGTRISGGRVPPADPQSADRVSEVAPR